MSLIKSVDVPKYMADKMRSRRIAARLAGAPAKPALVKPAEVSPATGTLVPTPLP